MERRAITVRGTVQGVGFRPYVYGLASRLGLTGSVRNAAGEVRIEVEGEGATLDRFVVELTSRPPPLARIDQLDWASLEPVGGAEFRIEASASGPVGAVAISPDVATCGDCIRELFDPADRRYRYPFLNCTNCGPRLTIIRGVPYDRGRTTMAGFRMCAVCRAEYEDPLNRRFHAQPTCCPACGPRLFAVDARGEPVGTQDPLVWFAEALRRGSIGALKGLGGYHLACDATNPAAVADLRRRKHRDAKPFAVMVRDLGAAETLCEVSAAERELLCSCRRPIVLLRRRADAGLAPDIAPDNPFLGVMLPYTPLHHLLMRDLGGVPLVMTSGNRSDEPIAHREPEVFHRLAGIADVFLAHDRPIHVRCDDSVTRVVGRVESPIRRSRGYAPQPIGLPAACSVPILAVGGQLKGTFALGRDRQAVISHHMGDLDHFEAFRAFERDVALYEEVLSLRPRHIACDLHPDYASTRYAVTRAAEEGMSVTAVQHHHAHVASCMVEHGLTDPVIGVSFDGTGYGTDGAVWGGEFLVATLGEFRRAAHLRYVPMPGGAAAIREPWRMAVAHLVDAGCDCDALGGRVEAAELRTVRKMIERRVNAPVTSSAGRLFDAVAAILGLCDRVSFEGQAAVRLEALANGAASEGTYPFDTASEGATVVMLDTRPLVRAVVRDAANGVDRTKIARRFHDSLAELIACTCGRVRKETGISTVVLTGGVFMNSLLTVETERRLQVSGFCAFRHRTVPPNDGGLCLGQLAVAACRVASGDRG